MKFIKDILDLFQGVPLDISEGNADINMEYGVVIHPTALRYKEEIVGYLKERRLNGEDLNKSFHKSWEIILESKDLIYHQILHYLSTYGTDFNDDIYIPLEELHVPLKLNLKVIKGISREEIVKRCISLLEIGVALKQETIIKILDILQEFEYPIHKIKCRNREAFTLIVDRTGVLPEEGDELFRYFFYKATGKTLVVNSKESRLLISNSGYTLPQLTNTQLSELSKSFNRNKDLWISFKSNKENIAQVNRIGKLNKKHHVTKSINILNSLTYKQFSEIEVESACRNATIFQLVRALNAVRFYMEDRENRVYRIRNGKSFTKVKITYTEIDLLLTYHEILLRTVKSRLKTQRVYYPDNIDYGIPVSEKMFIGNIPSGTVFTLPNNRESFLIGIYWKGNGIDLDLRGNSITESIGWNTSHKGEGLLYSGDITSAPNGATEWLYTRSIKEIYNIQVNAYHGADIDYPFKLILGYGSNPNKKYIIDPNKVLFEVPLTLTQREMSLGLLEQDDTNLRLYLTAFGTGNSRVGKHIELTNVMNKAVINTAKSSLRLKDLIPSVKEEMADVKLTPESLTKDSFLNLFI